MSHIRGWDDRTFHNRASLSVGRLARLKIRELKKREAIDQEAKLRRQQEKEQFQQELKKFHELAIMETLEQIPKPAPKMSILAKVISAITPSWLSSSASDKYGDIMSTGTMDTFTSEVSDGTWFVTVD